MLSLVPPRAGLALLLVLAACGDSGRATAGVSDTLGTSATSTPGPTSSGGPATTDTVSGGGSGSAASSALTGEPATGTLGETTAPDGTTTPGDTTSATTGTTGGTTGSSGCDVADVPDTLAFTYSKSIDLAPLDTIQASFYNQDAQEIVFFSYFGQGRRYSLEGQPLGDVMAPPEALPSLDGASFDQIKRVGMLINQNCAVVDVNPVTMQTLAVIQLDKAKLGLDTCAGVAIGVDGSMYVTSYFTDEIVVMTRDGQTELGRIDLAAAALPRPDGISLIAGSDNFLVLSTTMIQSGILSPQGNVVVGPAPTGQDMPPLIGGNITNPDAVLTVCGNGHAWLCDEYGTQCHDYVPMDGDKDACACTIPQ